MAATIRYHPSWRDGSFKHFALTKNMRVANAAIRFWQHVKINGESHQGKQIHSLIRGKKVHILQNPKCSADFIEQFSPILFQIFEARVQLMINDRLENIAQTVDNFTFALTQRLLV